jgi:acetate CoA/acetoacetate CoA-transferase beta subunit
MNKEMMNSMDKEKVARFIAKRIAAEFKKGDLVNLGVGIPTSVADFIKAEDGVLLHGENGVIGVGKAVTAIIDATAAGGTGGTEVKKKQDLVINAGAKATEVLPGASFFDSTLSFGLVRGGHVSATVLGTMEVDEEGNIANYMIPGKRVGGIGGAMDLCAGAKKLIVATYHTTGDAPKILKKCTLPLTAAKAVKVIVTEMGVFDVTPEGIKVREYNPAYTLEEIQAATGTKLIVPENVTTTPPSFFEGL